MSQSPHDKSVDSAANRPIADLSTIAAPPSDSTPDRRSTEPARATDPPLAAAIDDFELIRPLGEGSFGQVFLARQISLERQVAVKISPNRGNEARTLASLEHDHIVQVFSETIDLANNRRLLCMQYVPGTTLDRVISALNEREHSDCSGQSILDAIDSLGDSAVAFHPSALRDRLLLGESDYYQAVCWLGARLAEALAYAHRQHVLHRDIKPANILINPYGRPFLADFNISHQTTQPASDSAFGGTIGYMSPEHLDALHPGRMSLRSTVDERSDIYSLGIVLFEMLIGRRPFDREAGSIRADSLASLAAERRNQAPSPRRIRSDLPATLDRIITRCLEPDPSRRYHTASELADALEGCRSARSAQNQLPPDGPIAALTTRAPHLAIPLVALFPHMLGSVVNISYNAIEIVHKLTEAQQAAFAQMVLAYNSIMYPLCVAGLVAVSLPFFKLWRDTHRSHLPVDADRFDRVRQLVLRWPLWIVAFSCLGWLPGAIAFPVGIGWLSQPVSAEVFAHFVISFCISGLIALTYSFFGIQYVVLRVFYVQLWSDVKLFSDRTRAELSGVAGQLAFFQILAGCIPLFGAILMVGVGAEVTAYRTFRLLVTGLILLGMAGFLVAIRASHLLARILAAFTGSIVDRAASLHSTSSAGRSARSPV